MTIPSRPAPPPPQSNHQQQQNISGNKLNVLSKYNNKTKLSIKINENITSSKATISSQNKTYTNWNDIDPFDAITKPIENQNNIIKKKNPPPPRPPPPKIDKLSSFNKKSGGTSQNSINKLSNLFKNKKNTIKYHDKVQLDLLQKFPESNLSSTTYNYGSDGQSRPYAFVSPFMQQKKRNETELISFDSPPNSPKSIKKSFSSNATLINSNKDATSLLDLDFNNIENYETLKQKNSGFEDDFSLSSSTDPWESLTKNNISSSASQIYEFSKVSQPVRNINAVSNLKGDDILSNGKNILPPVPTLSMPTIIKPKPYQQIEKNSSSGASYKDYGFTNKKNIAPKAPATFVLKDDGNDFDYSLPMPNIPPPPPPDVNNDGGDIDPSEPSYGIALYDFDGLEEGDLPFRENEKVYILKKLNDNWFFGRNKRGCEGIFPTNYIDVKIPLNDEDETISRHSGASSSMSDRIYRAKCLYNFVGEVPEDLSFNENDIITVLYQINEDWLYGEIGDRKGQFPANFVEII